MLSKILYRGFATRVGVLGAGQMGTGIGIVSARTANYDVVYLDPNAAQLKKSQDFVNNWCAKEVKKEKMSEQDKQNVLNRCSWSSDIQSLSSCDLIVEAVNENFELKKNIFQ